MIGAIVQAHPSRRELVSRLRAGLEGMPYTEIETSFNPPNPWAAYQECLHALLRSGWTHGVIVQDDAIVCSNFPLAVERIATSHPETPVCLFIGGGPLGRKLMREGKRYVSMRRGNFYVPVVGMLWPRALAADILEWVPSAPTNVKPNPLSDDGMIGLWARLRFQKILVTFPSLVQHPDDQPSTIGDRARAQNGLDRKRVAVDYIGRRDPLELDW